MNGTTDKIKVRVKEAVGALTNDQHLKDEGKLDQATGAVKDGVGRTIDKSRHTFTGAHRTFGLSGAGLKLSSS